jgi:ATP-dependent helicase YprA (DUF1998 family)
MNALANSQFGELEKFLQFGYAGGFRAVRYARYTGRRTTSSARPSSRTRRTSSSPTT